MGTGRFIAQALECYVAVFVLHAFVSFFVTAQLWEDRTVASAGMPATSPALISGVHPWGGCIYSRAISARNAFDEKTCAVTPNWFADPCRFTVAHWKDTLYVRGLSWRSRRPPGRRYHPSVCVKSLSLCSLFKRVLLRSMSACSNPFYCMPNRKRRDRNCMSNRKRSWTQYERRSTT